MVRPCCCVREAPPAPTAGRSLVRKLASGAPFPLQCPLTTSTATPITKMIGSVCCSQCGPAAIGVVRVYFVGFASAAIFFNCGNKNTPDTVACWRIRGYRCVVTLLLATMAMPLWAVLLVGTVAALQACSHDVLVFTDDPSIKHTHSLFFNDLASRGYNLTFRDSGGSKAAAQKLG